MLTDDLAAAAARHGRSLMIRVEPSSPPRVITLCMRSSSYRQAAQRPRRSSRQRPRLPCLRASDSKPCASSITQCLMGGEILPSISISTQQQRVVRDHHVIWLGPAPRAMHQALVGEVRALVRSRRTRRAWSSARHAARRHLMPRASRSPSGTGGKRIRDRNRGQNVRFHGRQRLRRVRKQLRRQLVSRRKVQPVQARVVVVPFRAR